MIPDEQRPHADGAGFCPYKGLRPYTADDLPYFFGREIDSRILAGSMLARRLTILFGASGVGKSSVLGAGALPLVQGATGHRPIYFNTWQSDDFLDRLHADIAAAFIEPRQAAQILKLPHLAKAWAVGPGRPPTDVDEPRRSAPLVLILDQFEEFFLYRGGPRDAFTDELAELVNRRELDARVVIALRDDRLALLQRLAPNIPDILTNRIELEPLDRSGAEEACREPINTYNKRERRDASPIKIDLELVAAVIDSARITNTPAGLPLGEQGSKERFDAAVLQLTLTKLWQAERQLGSSRLRAVTFRTMGGGSGIAAAHLEEVLATLSADEVFLCGRFFDRLVTTGGSKVAQPYEALRDAAGLPQPGGGSAAPRPPFRQAIMQRLAGIIIRSRRHDPWRHDEVPPIPVAWPDQTRVERFGRLAVGASLHLFSTPGADILDKLLAKLSHASTFILRTVPSPARSERPGYEIFHDVLAVPIQTWLARFKQSVALVQDYKGLIIALAVATLVALFALASVGFGVWATLERNRAEQQLAEAQASLIWSRLEFRSPAAPLEEHEVDALWALTTSGGDVQWAFWNKLMENQAHLFKFARQPKPIVRAVIAKLTPEQAQAALAAVLDAFSATDPDQLEALAEAVQALPVQLTPEQAQAALAAVLDALKRATRPYQFYELTKAVQALAPKLTPEQAQAALTAVLDAFKRATDPDQLANAVANAVQALVPKLGQVPNHQMLLVARIGLGDAVAEHDAAAWAGAIEVLVRAQPDAAYLAEITEVLKYPMAAGQPTNLLLARLKERFPDAPGAEAGLDTNLAWIARRFPQIDLKSPPVRPGLHAKAGRIE